jgi:hypothetical protein
MLEQSARALAVAWYCRDDDDEETKAHAAEQWPGFTALARAALQAIREPDAVMLQGGEDAMEGYMDDDLEPVFTAMIDAILNEKPGGTT